MTSIEIVSHIDHPFLPGVKADVMSIDECCKLLNIVKEQKSRLQACEYQLRSALTLLTNGDTQTRHLKGEAFLAKVTMPKPSWSQSTLKDLWEADPMQSKLYLRVATLAPNLREVEKMERTNGNEQFEAFKKKLLSARSPPTSVPNISVSRIAEP